MAETDPIKPVEEELRAMLDDVQQHRVSFTYRFWQELVEKHNRLLAALNTTLGDNDAAWEPYETLLRDARAYRERTTFVQEQEQEILPRSAASARKPVEQRTLRPAEFHRKIYALQNVVEDATQINQTEVCSALRKQYAFWVRLSDATFEAAATTHEQEAKWRAMRTLAETCLHAGLESYQFLQTPHHKHGYGPQGPFGRFRRPKK